MKLHPEIAALLAEIDAFIEREQMNPTAFGVSAIKDPNLYRHLRGGRLPSLRTLDRIRAFMLRRERSAA